MLDNRAAKLVKALAVISTKMTLAGMKREGADLLEAAMLLEELAVKLDRFGARRDAETIEKVKALVASGRTIISVAREFGVGNSTAQRWCKDVVKPRENRGRKAKRPRRTSIPVPNLGL